jgi:drug/metabolite transporter (DMT)-like permease
MNSLTGQLLALITAACWAQNSIVYAAAGKRVGSTTVTHVRLWISLPAIILVHLLMTGSVIPPGLQLRETILLFVSGLCGYCVADLFIFRAFVDLGPRNTLVVLTLSPIFSTVISWFTLVNAQPPRDPRHRPTVLGVIWVVESERRDPKNEGKRHSGMGLLCAFMGALSRPWPSVLAKAAWRKTCIRFPRIWCASSQGWSGS